MSAVTGNVRIALLLSPLDGNDTGQEEDEQTVAAAAAAAAAGDRDQVVATVVARGGRLYTPYGRDASSSSSSSSSSSDGYEEEKGETTTDAGGDHEIIVVEEDEDEDEIVAVAPVEVGAGVEEVIVECGRNEQEEVPEATAALAANATVGRGTVPKWNEAGEIASPPPPPPPSEGEDDEQITAMDIIPSAVLVAASGKEELKIGGGRGRLNNGGKKQKYRNGTSITMHFDNNDDYWESEYGEHKDGIIVGYDCQWNYTVRFPMKDVYDDDNNNNININNESSFFLELVPGATIYDHLSENNACFLVKKHWGKLIEEQGGGDDNDNDDIDDQHGAYRARILRGYKRYIADNTTGAYAIDWNVFLTDLNRVPKIASINILSEDNYFGLLSDEYANYPYVNVFFLAMITACPNNVIWNNVIERLIELNPRAIDHHHIHNDHGYEIFYEDCVAANPDVFLNIDPEILRVLLRHTKKHEEGICFGYENYAMCLIREFLKRQMVSLSPDNVVMISPHVKVILEENCYVVSTFLAEEYISEKSSVLSSIEDGGGVGSLLCKEVLRFALECASRNINKCFNSKIELYRENYDTLICISLLQAMLLWLRKVDNRDLFHRYMKVYMTESNDDSISLVNCVLDTLPKQNKMYYWGIFWNVFKDDDWGKEDATTSCSPSPRHPLFTAIRLQCHSEIILDIITKDPSILDSLDSYESLPPFAIVAATRSYEDRIHPPKQGSNDLCLYRNQFYGPAIICGTCANDCIYNNHSQHNDIDSTYELLRMNPAVIGSNLLSQPPPSTITKITPSSGNNINNRKRLSINACIDDGRKRTTTTAQPLRRSKRVKKSSDSNNSNSNNINHLHHHHNNKKNNNNLRMRLRLGEILSIITRRRTAAAAVAAAKRPNTTTYNKEQRDDDSMVSTMVVSECDTAVI
jgi:hypothetical protein